MLSRKKPARILVVDDEPGVTKALRRVLEQNEFDVECRLSAEDGLQAARNGDFDLVISDYRMEGMNGVEMLGEIASHSPSTCRMLLTGFADLRIAKSAINEGKAHAFLEKPWNDDGLVLAIERTLEYQRISAENAQLRNALFLQKLSSDAAAGSPKELMRISLSHLCGEFGFCFGSGFLVAPTTGNLEKVADEWTHSDFHAPSRPDAEKKDLLGIALSECSPQTADVSLNEESDPKNRLDATAVAIPLMCNRKAIGCLFFLHPKNRPLLTETNMEFFKAIGLQVGTIIENMRLRKHSAEKDKMAAVGMGMACLSHDIKNILTSISLGGEMLLQRINDVSCPQLPKASNMIVKGTRHLSNLVDEILDFAKPQKPAFHLYDLRELLDEIVMGVKTVANGRSIEIVLEPHAPAINMIMDRTRLYRCLLNIALNGLEAMGNTGTLSIKTREVDPPLSMFSTNKWGAEDPPKAIQISISDTGHGIEADALENLFTPYFTTKESKGTGLGLAIAKQIAEEHGGLIYVDSKPSEGTTFTIFLPLARRAGDISAQESDDSPNEPEEPEKAGKNRIASLPPSS